ncbi:conserved repeat protein [Thermus filiformis]|uniref:Conserved repeat protein n=2 Tax=Thermus filiformis TaxID=276 RepID=A0A0D6XAQ9_THEFI|nr:conserved repeat protein [Thermus filiformis]
MAWAVGLALAAGTPAGTAITNQAAASYIDSANQPRTTTSNLVTTIVQQVYAFSITPDGTETSPGQTRSNLPGGQVLFQYTVTNSGNGTDTINLNYAQGANGTSDDFDLLNVQIYKDDNCNGNVDAGEAQVTSLTLGADDTACVVVVATIPTTATNGQYGNLNLTGASSGGPTDTNNWARAVATTAAALTAFKAASPTGSVAPGSTITYTISGSNTGGSAAHAVTSVVTVDGNSKNGILITDVIPSGLTYVSGSLSGSAGAGTVTLIYSTNGGTTWTATQPASGVNAVGMLIEGSGAFFPQGASYTLSFQVQVPSGASAGTSYANSATVQFSPDGTTTQLVTTNSTTNTVGASYDVRVGPYQYPEAGATGSYTVSGYTVNRSGDAQTINSAYSGTQVVFRHTLKNTGNTSDSFTLSFSGAPSGWTCSLLADDLTTPLSGPVGPLPAGGTYDFALKCAIPSTYTGGSVTLNVIATSQGDSSKTDSAQDTVTSVDDGFRFDLYGGVNGTGNYTYTQTTSGTDYTSDDSGNPTRVIYQSGTTFPSANPGAQVVYRLRVKNLNFNGLPDNYQLLLSGVDTTRIASILFYADANDDGTPDGAPISNTGLVNAGQEFKFLAVVTLRPDAAPGAAGFKFEAQSTQSGAEPKDFASSQVNVNTVAQVLLDPDRSGTVTSPGTIQYTHTLINNSNAPATCNVSGNGGSYGWTYLYSTDGTSWQASLSGVSVAPNGGTQTIYVRVQVPAGEPIGRTDVNTVTASCTVGSASASDTATETTTVVGGELRLQKSAVSYVGSTSTVRDPAGATAYPGDRIVYTITAENIGTGNLTNVRVSDPIPAYTTFVSVSATAAGFPAGSTILYSTDGTTWSATAPSSVPTGGAVYVGVDTNGDGTIDANDVMPPGASITITLTVQVQ